MDTAISIGAGIGSVFFIGWMISMFHENNENEYKKNERFEELSNHQVKWHIRHIREDLKLLCYIAMGIFGLLLANLLKS